MGSESDRILEEILKQTKLSPEVLLEAFKAISQNDIEREKVKLEVESKILERESARGTTKLTFWSGLPWAALFTLIGGVTTAVSQGWFQTAQNRDTQSAGYDLEILQQQYAAFQYLVNVEPADFPEEEARKRERRSRICMAIQFGVVSVPPQVLGVSSVDNVDYSKKLADLLTEYECEGGDIPESFPAPPSVTIGRTTMNLCSPGAPVEDRSLILAREVIDGSGFNYDVLRLAVGELNAGIHELTRPDRISDYLSEVSILAGARQNDAECLDTPWSSAFISYLISKAGNEAQLELSLSGYDILSSAHSKSMIYRPSEGAPEPGDLIFFARNVSMLQWATFRDTGVWPTQYVDVTIGVVYSMDDGKIVYIGGNMQNRVDWASVSKIDPAIIGFVNL